MSSIGSTKRRKMEFKRQQIIDRGHNKAKRKQERAASKGATEGAMVLLPWSQRQKNITEMTVNSMVDEFDDPTEPLNIYDDYGAGA